jgi:hypothetical protein
MIISNPPFILKIIKLKIPKRFSTFSRPLPFEDLVEPPICYYQKWNFLCNHSLQRRRTIWLCTDMRTYPLKITRVKEHHCSKQGFGFLNE